MHPALRGSKTPPQVSEVEDDKWGSTAPKSPIGSTNNQWGWNPPLIEVSLYQNRRLQHEKLF
ncbi:hypothetical protein A8F94_18595 [Bacillus sp. FJAT-27225]|nr:hypothetical protein A8F94_18595 [Bacillus sp. FJAT-27225]